MMKFLLTAVNAKYIHSNPGIYSLKAYAEKNQGGAENQCLPGLHREMEKNGTGKQPEIELAEYTINHQMELILEDIYRRKPDMVGFSCYIWNIRDVLELVHDLHKVLPDTDIWVGGPEVTYDAAALLMQEPEVLGVMKGEGERTFSSLLTCYADSGKSVRTMLRERALGIDTREPNRRFWEGLAQIPGITYRDEQGEIQDHPVRPVMDMSSLPFLYDETLEGFANRIIYYESSRGCPFSCSYCLSSVDKSVRFRDPELVKQELQFFIDKKVPQVKFVDRTFNCKKSHTMEIWKYLIEHDNGITNFHFELAADLLDEDELALIARMRPGLIQLEIGIQSTNPVTLEEIRRKMDLAKVKQVFYKIKAGHNVHQHLDLIVGLPYEDYASFRRSFNEVYEMKPEQLQMGFLKVLKGSLMYEKAEEYALVYRSTPPYEVLSTRWVSYAEVLTLKGIEDMLEVHYNSGQFTNTLELLEREFTDAFSMFEALSAYYDREGLRERNHNRTARYEILHAFLQQLPERKADLAEYEDAMITDLYLRENCKSRPSFALDQSAFKDRIRERMPELRKLGAMVHAEVMHSGALWLFDYRERDPLTKNAKRILMEPARTKQPEGDERR